MKPEQKEKHIKEEKSSLDQGLGSLSKQVSDKTMPDLKEAGIPVMPI